MAIAAGYRLQLIVLVVSGIGRVRIAGSAFSGNQWPDIEPIELLPWKLGSGQSGDHGKEIDRHPHFVAHRPGGNLPRPTHDARNPRSSLPCRSLAFTQWTSGSGMIPIIQPWPIVRSEEN